MQKNSGNSKPVVFPEQNNSKTLSKSCRPCNRPYLCMCFFFVFFIYVPFRCCRRIFQAPACGERASGPQPCSVQAALIRLHRRLCFFALLTRECVNGSRPVFILPCAPSERAPNPAAWHLPADSCRGAGNARFQLVTNFCFVAAAYYEKQRLRVVCFVLPFISFCFFSKRTNFLPFFLCQTCCHFSAK